MRDYEPLYELDPKDPRALPGLGDIANYAVRTIKAGEIVELEAYPVFRPGTPSRKAAQQGGTRDAQKRVNERNRRKNIARLINANFGVGDVAMTLTYEQAPSDAARAGKDLRNYVERLKRLHARMVRGGALPESHELKWLAVTETTTKDGRLTRAHHHLVCNIPDRDALEACWRRGRANARRLQPDRFGLTALAHYMAKAPASRSRLRHSRNLKGPRITYAQRKLSRRRAALIAQDMDCFAPEILRKLYPGTEYLSCEVHLSEFAQGAYIYAVMRKAITAD